MLTARDLNDSSSSTTSHRHTMCCQKFLGIAQRERGILWLRRVRAGESSPCPPGQHAGRPFEPRWTQPLTRIRRRVRR